MEGQDEVLLALLDMSKRILAELELLTSSIKATALIRFQREFLGTVQRQNMYQAINGENDSQGISQTTNAPLRTVQSFIKELVENDLVDYDKRGKALILRKAISKISTYYLRKDIEMAGQVNE